MKVVLFCGGLGMRIRDYSDTIPKPMVPIGHRPILWHVMRYYAHFGHKEFILYLGYKADVIKKYFLNYDECLSNDFTLSGAGNVSLANSDIHDWKISFVDTGINTNIGGRLRAIRDHLGGDEYFLANYSDNLTDVALPEMIDKFRGQDRVASFLCVRPSQSFHMVSLDQHNVVTWDMPYINTPDRPLTRYGNLSSSFISQHEDPYHSFDRVTLIANRNSNNMYYFLFSEPRTRINIAESVSGAGTVAYYVQGYEFQFVGGTAGKPIIEWSMVTKYVDMY